jgi:hypothetical protein
MPDNLYLAGVSRPALLPAQHTILYVGHVVPIYAGQALTLYAGQSSIGQPFILSFTSSLTLPGVIPPTLVPEAVKVPQAERPW